MVSLGVAGWLAGWISAPQIAQLSQKRATAREIDRDQYRSILGREDSRCRRTALRSLLEQDAVSTLTASKRVLVRLDVVLLAAVWSM